MRKQLLNKRYRDLVEAERMVDVENSKKKRKPTFKFWSDYAIKHFTTRWFKGLTRTMDAVVKRESTSDDGKVIGKSPAKIMSRGDLSNANTSEARTSIYNAKDICLGNKGFYGTPLPLIPDIRKSEVSEGVVGTLLETFGMTRRFGRQVTLSKGPNRKANRYLVHQYNRLIKSIDAKTIRGNSLTPAHVLWEHNFYKLTDPERKNKLLKKDRHYLQEIARKYWCIANRLIRSSHAFRIAVIKKSLGKTGKWFHRNYDIKDLFEFNRIYQTIADQFLSNLPCRRFWINTEMRDGSFKWRPLGISPIPWRIYTRGLNNLLETFISASWPQNQHGYKSGRGVHTVWNHILRTVIHAKFIYEFDFSGFFNTVKIEAVGNVLNRFCIPKYMTAYLVLLSSSDVTNIKTDKMLDLINTKEPTEMGWAKAWSKHEYIHKYRKGFRSKGLVQGFALSPLLSVVTLIVLDELEKKGIKHLLFADDGLFYSDIPINFLTIAQECLDKHGIGAHFNFDKSHRVKWDDIWLRNLKMVGLIYDPFTDILAASTRNGATLKLSVGSIAVFSHEEVDINASENMIIPIITETDHLHWPISNNALINVYENIFIADGFTDDRKSLLYNKLALSALLVMKQRFLTYTPWTLANAINDSTEDNPLSLIDFILPIRLLKNIAKEDYYELITKYTSWMDSPFPWDLFKSPVIKSTFWMDEEYTAKEYDKILNEKVRNYKKKVAFEATNSHHTKATAKEIITKHLGSGTEMLLDSLVWFRKLNDLPEALKPHFEENKTCELGNWFEITLDNALAYNLSPSVISHLKKYNTKVGFTQVNWRNLYMDPIFATFVARLFNDTFRNSIAKQDFRLTHDKSTNNIMKIIHRHIGLRAFNSMLNENRLDIFNASSFCSNYLLVCIDRWSRRVFKKNAHKVPMYNRAYKAVLNRIANRRTCRSVSVDGIILNDPNPGTTDEDMWTAYNFPLRPYKTPISDKNKVTRQHLLNKYSVEEGLHIDTITRCAISEHTRFMSFHDQPLYSLPKSVRWDTWSKKPISLPKYKIKPNVNPVTEPLRNNKFKPVWTKLMPKVKPNWTPITHVIK